MEVARVPQLRDVRRIQHKRERLEGQILELQQQEQRAIASAAVTTPMPGSGYLSVAKREDRQQPLACIKGRGKYLVPMLEPSPQCPHEQTTHGANRLMSYQTCKSCKQSQQMPLVPIQDLQVWNQQMAFHSTEFLKRLLKTDVKDAPATSSKARAKPKAGSVREPVEIYIGQDEDLEMEVVNNALTQPCTRCLRGQVVLCRRQLDHELTWNCNNPQCEKGCADPQRHLEPAHGIFLCPECQAAEVIKIRGVQDQDETWQCMECTYQRNLQSLQRDYAEIDRFDEDYLGWASG